MEMNKKLKHGMRMQLKKRKDTNKNSDRRVAVLMLPKW